MTTTAEIERQIKDDYDRFWDGIYDGFLPEGLIEKFKIAMRIIPPGVHKYQIPKLQSMLQKQEYDLTFVEVGMIINVIFSMSFDILYDSVEEGLKYTLQLERIRDEFNDMVDKKSGEIEKKKQRLLSISGIVKSTTFPGAKN